MSYHNHPCEEVRSAIIRLSDALCMWERNTGRQSVLILKEDGMEPVRLVSGKPGLPDDITDEQAFAMVTP